MATAIGIGVGTLFGGGNGGGVPLNTLIAADARFRFTGQETVFRVAHEVAADSGSFSFTGQDATLRFQDRVLSAEAASFAMTGQAATMTIGAAAGQLEMNAQSGAFNYTGDTMTPVTDYRLVAETATFAFSGQAASLEAGHELVGEAASFAFTGQDATLTEGSTSPVATFIGTVTPSTSGVTATATAANIGTSASDRKVVVIVTNNFSNFLGGCAMTIGGNSATQEVFAGNNGASCGIFSLDVPSGTTADIVATNSGGGGWGGCRFHVYTITGLSSGTKIASNSNSNSSVSSISTTVNTNSGGVIIAGCAAQSQNVSNFNGGTETFTTDNGGATSHGAGHATNVAANTPSTVNANGSGTNWLSIAAVSYR